MKLGNSKKVELSNGAEVWITELPGGKIRLFHAGQTKKKKNMDDGPAVEVTVEGPSIVTLTFSGS